MRTLRVVWVPGGDLLRGICHCGAEHVAEGPAEIWEWLLGHPDGHDAAPPPVLVAAPSGAGAAP